MKFAVLILLVSAAMAQSQYDLLLKGGHVIDAKSHISEVRDVAIQNGRIAEISSRIDPAKAAKVVNVSGLYVTPGLVDIHVHVYAGTGMRGAYSGDNSVYPDGFTFRVGVTTVADAGSSGWRNFPDFKDRVIDRSHTRVLAFLNIVGRGMGGGKIEQDVDRYGCEGHCGAGPTLSRRSGGRENGALHGPGMDAGGARGRSGNDRQYPGDGRFRGLPSGAPVPGAGDQEAAPGRYIHAYVPRRGPHDR